MFRKILGILILTFIALPSLILVTWSVALTRTISSPEFLSDFPIQLIKETPDLIDLFQKEILESPQAAENLNSRLWMTAIALTEPSPRELLSRTGVFEWMDTDLTNSLAQLGDTLRNKQLTQPVILNLTKLKNSLADPQVEEYILTVFTQLPECNDLEIEIWQQSLKSNIATENDYGHQFEYSTESYDLPACKPDQQTIDQILTTYQDTITEIPDQQQIYDPHGQTAQLLEQAKNALYAFVLPVVILLIGTIIISIKLRSILNWSGTYLIAGAIISWLPSLLLRPITDEILNNFLDVSWQPVTQGITSQISSSITLISVITGAIGIILIIISIILNKIHLQESPVDENQPAPPGRYLSENSPPPSDQKPPAASPPTQNVAPSTPPEKQKANNASNNSTYHPFPKTETGI